MLPRKRDNTSFASWPRSAVDSLRLFAVTTFSSVGTRLVHYMPIQPLSKSPRRPFMDAIALWDKTRSF